MLARCIATDHVWFVRTESFYRPRCDGYIGDRVVVVVVVNFNKYSHIVGQAKLHVLESGNVATV